MVDGICDLHFKTISTMAGKKKVISVLMADEEIVNKIYFIRGQKVMLDRDLAEMYGIETKQLKRQVKRNLDRFPEDFMFQLSEVELKILRSQFGTLQYWRLTKTYFSSWKNWSEPLTKTVRTFKSFSNN